MKRRTVIVISLTAALAAVVVLTFFLRNRPVHVPEYKDPDEGQRIAISHFDETLIQYMEVISANGTLKLRKEGDEWKVPDYPHPIKLRESKVEDLVYSFARMYSERIVDENPTDLDVYGLTQPIATGRCELSDGSWKEFYIGDKTSAGNSYYLKAKDNPVVYAVWMNHASHFQYVLDDLREERLTDITLAETTYLKIIEGGETLLEIIRREDLPDNLVTMVTSRMYVLAPYSQPQALSSDSQDALWGHFGDYRIAEYKEDRPTDLSQYGLDNPRVIYIHRDQENSRHLRFGDSSGDLTYFQIQGDPAVYAMKTKGNFDFLQIKPFEYIDKYAFLVNIQNVVEISIKAPGVEHILGIQRINEGDENESTTYLFDGDERDEKVFKSYYQSLIGILFDAEHTENLREQPEVEIEFNLRNIGNASSQTESTGNVRYRASLVPYDEDFYALFTNGQSRFLVNRSQVDQMLEDLERLSRGEKALFM